MREKKTISLRKAHSSAEFYTN